MPVAPGIYRRGEVGRPPRPGFVRVSGQVVLGPRRCCSIAMQDGGHFAIGRENLHPLVAPIGYIDIAAGIHRHRCRTMQLALAVPGRPPLADEPSLRRESLHPVVAPVGHEHIAGGIAGQAPRGVELASLRAIPAPSVQIFAIGGKTLHPMVQPIAD